MGKHKKFIKECYEGKHGSMCNDWKRTIENKYPEFKNTLEVGKWYKIDNDDGYLLNLQPNRTAYGFMGGSYKTNYDFNDYHHENSTPATKEEVEQALIKEAKKRGFKEGVTFRSPDNILAQQLQKYEIQPFFYRNYAIACKYEQGVIFYEGKWAEIIPNTITKEEAEKQLGKKIVS